MASAAAKRYASALFEMAESGKDFDSWRRRLAAVQELLGDPYARRVLANPSLSRERRAEAVRAAATPAMGAEGLNLALLLVENNRIGEIDGVVEEFQRLADEAQGRVRATVTTAVDLSDADRRRLESGLRQSLGGDVTLEARVDPAIVGGLILKVGDHLVDASLATRLQQLRRSLASS